MIALLEYGRFTTLLQLRDSELLHTIMVPKPPSEAMLYDTSPSDSAIPKYKLEFRLKEQLSRDLLVYEFVGEA